MSTLQKIAFLSFDFNIQNIRKQPWNYIYRICKGFIERDDHVVIITDGGESEIQTDTINNIRVYKLGKIRPWNTTQIQKIIYKEKIDIVFWSFTPKSVVFFHAFQKINKPIILFISLPLYSFREILRAQKVLGYYNLFPFFINCLVPDVFFRKIINSNYIRAIISLTKKNQAEMISYNCLSDKIWYVPHGNDSSIGSSLLTSKIKKKIRREFDKLYGCQDKKIVLYMGGHEKIRGLYWLIKSFSEVIKVNSDLRLLILLRTKNEQLIKNIKNECESKGIKESAIMISGILLEQDINRYLSICDFVALPFVLVPSEVPISILESMAAGKPVIGTSVDGIPELIKDRGIIVKPGDSCSMKNALLNLAEDDSLRERLSLNCTSYMAEYPDWKIINSKIASFLESN